MTVQPNPSELISSQIGALVSSYIPQSIALSLGLAVQSAASAAGTTGGLTDIIQLAINATTTPSWITLLPTEYQPNIVALESAIAALRAGASSPLGSPTASASESSATGSHSTSNSTLVS